MKSNSKEDAVSISIGFILNMGIAMVFIAAIFLVLQGFLADTGEQTEDQLEQVGSEMVTMMVKVDTLAQTQGCGNVFYQPPESGLEDYTVVVNNGGTIEVHSGRSNVTLEYSTVSSVSGSLEFTESNTGGRIGYDGGTIYLGGGVIC